MKRWFAILMALLSLILVSRAHPVIAATATGTLTIEKRISVDNDSAITQQTQPLAGAKYQLVRVQVAAGNQIDATRPESYQAVPGAAALNVILTTDATGIARLDGLVIGADYILTELPGDGVTKPAAPVLLRFSTQRTSYIYSPKSGLLTTSPKPSQPVPGEEIGNGTMPAKPKTILQTGGVMTHPLGWLLAAMIGALAVAMLGMTSWLQLQHKGH